MSMRRETPRRNSTRQLHKCKIINKNVLEWFLLIMCKDHILARSTNLISRNHLKICFGLKRKYRLLHKKQSCTLLTPCLFCIQCFFLIDLFSNVLYSFECLIYPTIRFFLKTRTY